MAVSSVFALLCRCSLSGDIPRARSISISAPAQCLDLFFFNDDTLGRLDSYQRFDSFTPGDITGACTRGRRLLAVLANSPGGRYTWAEVNSWEGLQKMKADLRKENPLTPIMRGKAVLEAGDDRMVHIGLTPLLSLVELSSISCDFSGKSYEGATLSEWKAYLTNVNATCSIFGEEEGAPVDILNRGGLREYDLEQMACPWMIYAEMDSPPLPEPADPGLSFYCYPNLAEEETLGTPFTRLVIEGKVDGERWYWPLDIGREEYPGGIQGGMSYSFEVRITRLGVKDPDTPVDGITARATINILPWKELYDRYIDY